MYMCVCVGFVAPFPSYSATTAPTSDSISDKERDVKDISATYKVDLGGTHVFLHNIYMHICIHVSYTVSNHT